MTEDLTLSWELPVSPYGLLSWLLDRLDLTPGPDDLRPCPAVSNVRLPGDPLRLWQIERTYDSFTLVQVDWERVNRGERPRSEWSIVPRGMERCTVRVSHSLDAPAESLDAAGAIPTEWPASAGRQRLQRDAAKQAQMVLLPAVLDEWLRVIPKESDREIVRYWRQGLTEGEIADKQGFATKTIHNRIIDLRKKFPNLLPRRK